MPSMSLFSATGMRWWFRSRSTGKLNGTSYWLVAFLTACALTVVLSLTWRTAGSLEQDFEFSDWVRSALPNEPAADSPFPAALKPLIDRLQVRKDNADSTQIPLYAADSIQDKDQRCNTAASMFDESDIGVYPECVTYTATSPKKELSASEKFVFENFAAYIVPTFKNAARADNTSKHTERHLADIVGLAGAGVDEGQFDVPWIYVASQKGAVAVFPGTTLIAGRYDTQARPWWQAAFKGESQLAATGRRSADLLTVPYLDILVNKPILVRTYISKVNVYIPELKTMEPFVICVDLHRRDYQPVAELWFLHHRLSATPWKVMFGFACAVSLAIFGMIRWISGNSAKSFVFQRSSNAIYGIVDRKRTAQVSSGLRSAKKTTFSWNLSKYVGVSGESSKEASDAFDNETAGQTTPGTRRGLEWWGVAKGVRCSWRLFGLQFESASQTYIGTIELSYTHAILPAAEWYSFNDEDFSDAEVQRYRSLTAVLQLNANGSAEKFEIPETTASTQSLSLVAQLPEWVRSVTDAEKLVAAGQKRAYVTLSSTRLDELYAKSDVKAVILSGYLERLLKNGQIEFLLKGRTIHRLVSFPNADATLGLSGLSLNRYRDLMKYYSPVNSRTLARVNESINIEGIPQPPYDFAILNADDNPAEQMLVVSHSVTEASLIDIASGQESTPVYHVEGYLSWRESDIRFYSELFESLAKKSVAMSSVAVEPLHTVSAKS